MPVSIASLLPECAPNRRLGKTDKPVLDIDRWIAFQPKQLDAVRAAANHKRILYGGAAGGGKSYLERWLAIRDLIRMHAQYGVRGIRVGLFCETYPVLHDRQISKVQAEVPRWLGKYNAQRHELTLAPRYGSGVLCFRNLADPSSYLSAEFAKVFFDELTQASEEQYDFICTRCRWSGLPAHEFTAFGATNPGGPGHVWVKRRWVLRHLSPKERRHSYAFVQALALDNHHLPDGYYEDLLSLPDKLAKAYAEGNWDVFEGQFFEMWDSALHIIPPTAIPPQWTKFRMGDWGYRAPAAIMWGAINPWMQQLIIYRELYATQLPPDRLARTVLDMTPETEQISYTVMDPSIWNNTKGEGCIADDLTAHGLACQPGNNDRISGWIRMREMMQPLVVMHNGQPLRFSRLVFTANCQQCIATIPSLVHDDKRVEDVDTDGVDHAGDGVRYGVMSMPAFDVSQYLREADAYHQANRLEGLLKEFPSLQKSAVGQSARSTGAPTVLTPGMGTAAHAPLGRGVH